ncbi:ferrochelatase [Arenibaculum pallidiluteum]|uniref:ferrochelatase n=1 Tax=Arenibaculum pallidiluteum TaxID=2812559 RepID=UPI001A95E7FD|nr:ferrochelatase [Arenibaculum pallidiluteum]
MDKPRIAVVLFNLGGPDRLDAVRPFLFNLFADPAIIRTPAILRIPLAYALSRRRARQAVPIYRQLGGGSPLLANTEAQARALEAALADRYDARCFVAMRYWHPMSDETAHAVKAFDPKRIILLPLYPQFSTTTTASSIRVWDLATRAAGVDVPTSTICCYPTEQGFIEASAKLVREAYDRASAHGRPRVLFSAHGLPRRVVRGGDPYQWQCERTTEALVARLGIPGLDWTNCYQSRVGPLEWIGPSTDQEIERAGRDGAPVVVVPITFVSEHSETLVEIEIEYRHLAQTHGVPWFERVPAVGAEPAFIQGLAALVGRTAETACGVCSERGGQLCPAGWRGCPQAA